MKSPRWAGMLVVVAAVGGLMTAKSQPEKLAPATLSSLDFWVGEWKVETVDGELAGTNRIEKELSGAAIVEHWTSADGSEGKSFFYFMPDKKQWKQVWVTADGTYKEKMSKPVENGIRFRGTAFLKSGQSFPDRTTLTREPDGRVRQVIEYSTDEGETWKTSFEAIYTKV